MNIDSIEYFAWRRFARAWPVLALLALLLIPGVWEWVTQMRVERAIHMIRWVSAVLMELVVQPFVENLQSDLPGVHPTPAPAAG